MKEKPYILLTLRRTGGTSLSTFLASCSTASKVMDEPFNVDRIWAGITKMAEANTDTAVLRKEVMTVLANRPVFKHCLEIVPIRLNQVIIECGVELGYTFFVLTRRNETSRIISLALAKATGAWGPADARRIYPKLLSGELTPQPILIDQAVAQANSDAAKLGHVLKMLRHRRVHYEWIIFEEIYNGTESPQEQAVRLATCIGRDISMDDERLAVFSKIGNQNSAQIEKLFPKLDELRERLKNVCIE